MIWLTRLSKMTADWWRGLAAMPPDPAETALCNRLDPPEPVSPARFPALLEVLQRGEVAVIGPARFGSNRVWFVTVTAAGQVIGAVYKPTAGERPLAGFPPRTLARREVAAYLVSRALGWPLVPPTTCRPDGPHGPGALQLYLPAGPAGDADELRLRQVALFDGLANNADRKPGHLRRDPFGSLWSIDHGLCFHHQPKLRTFLHQFDRQPIPAPLLSDVAGLHESLTANSPLAELLAPPEIAALRQRIEHLLTMPYHPPS